MWGDVWSDSVWCLSSQVTLMHYGALLSRTWLNIYLSTGSSELIPCFMCVAFTFLFKLSSSQLLSSLVFTLPIIFPSSTGRAVSEQLGCWLGFKHNTLYWSCGVSNSPSELRSEIRLRQVVMAQNVQVDFFLLIFRQGSRAERPGITAKVNLGFHTIANSCTAVWFVVVKKRCHHTC